MRKAGAKSYEKYSKILLRICKKKPISLEVFADNFMDMEKQALKINSWGNLQKKGNYIKEHRHNNTQFSGVFYLQTPENSGDIIFTTRNATWINSYWEPSLTGYDDLNSFEKRFRPQQCGIFLFPAHLDHYVTPSHSEEERYSISFNYNLDGKFFGDCNNHLTIKVL